MNNDVVQVYPIVNSITYTTSQAHRTVRPLPLTRLRGAPRVARGVRRPSASMPPKGNTAKLVAKLESLVLQRKSQVSAQWACGAARTFAACRT